MSSIIGAASIIVFLYIYNSIHTACNKLYNSYIVSLYLCLDVINLIKPEVVHDFRGTMERHRQSTIFRVHLECVMQTMTDAP